MKTSGKIHMGQKRKPLPSGRLWLPPGDVLLLMFGAAMAAILALAYGAAALVKVVG